MTAQNFDEVLNGLRQRRPFQVFTIELHGGQRFEVDHPGAIVIRDGVAVFLAPGGTPTWFDHDSVNQIIGARAAPMLETGPSRRLFCILPLFSIYPFPLPKPPLDTPAPARYSPRLSTGASPVSAERGHC